MDRGAEGVYEEDNCWRSGRASGGRHVGRRSRHFRLDGGGAG